MNCADLVGEIYRDRMRLWRWRLTDFRNRKIIAMSGDGHLQLRHARSSFEKATGLVAPTLDALRRRYQAPWHRGELQHRGEL